MIGPACQEKWGPVGLGGPTFTQHTTPPCARLASKRGSLVYDCCIYLPANLGSDHRWSGGATGRGVVELEQMWTIRSICIT